MAATEKQHQELEVDASASTPMGGFPADCSTSTVNPSRDHTRPTVSDYLRDKEREWNRPSERKGPLTLLELPVDILRLIVKEASLLLCHTGRVPEPC